MVFVFPQGSPAASSPTSLITNLLKGLTSLLGLLSTAQQNGASLLGTLQAPNYPPFLTNNPLPFGAPWGSLGPNANPSAPPNTGVTRQYDFTVTRGTIKPDGVSKNVIMLNGAFPGPTIEANWGDEIMVTVHNQITDPGEGIAFHWHGFLQPKTQWMDGVPAVSQCPIAPGATFTYKFQADTYGTTWYHSHYSGQYSDGLLGPIIIHGPTNAPYDIDVGPILLTDYYHRSYFDIVEQVMSAGGNVIPISDNNLINGKGVFNCSLTSLPCTPNAGLPKFRFRAGKKHRLRLINAGAEGMQRFSIDGHQLTVIANDFVPIKPYTTEVVTLGIGQRADVIVTANAGTIFDTFWMRSNLSTACSFTSQPFALGVIGYDLADLNTTPKSKAWNVPDPGTCFNDALTVSTPTYSVPAVAKPDLVQPYNIGIIFNGTGPPPDGDGSLLWTVNGQTFRADYNDPVLLHANTGNLTFPPISNVYNFGSNGSITFVINNPPGFPVHPIHMHGHSFSVLNQGPGTWDGTTINPSNPQRRDVILVPGGGFAAVQIVTDNPGAWPFHCHIAWHVSAGLYMTILEHPDEVKKLQIPQVMADGCKSWDAWTSRNVVDQIDSGL